MRVVAISAPPPTTSTPPNARSIHVLSLPVFGRLPLMTRMVVVEPPSAAVVEVGGCVVVVVSSTVVVVDSTDVVVDSTTDDVVDSLGIVVSLVGGVSFSAS